MITEEDRRFIEEYAILLTDELVLSESLLKNILANAFKMEDKDSAIKYINDEVWNLIVFKAGSVTELAEAKNGTKLPPIFVTAFLASVRTSVQEKVSTYAVQFMNEIENKKKLPSFYKPKIDKDTLSLAREAAGLQSMAKSSITNLKVIVTATLTDAMDKADLFLMSGNGAYGYIGVRGSSYDCPYCDSLCGYIIPIETQVFPAHPRCVCGMIPVYG